MSHDAHHFAAGLAARTRLPLLNAESIRLVKRMGGSNASASVHRAWCSYFSGEVAVKLMQYFGSAADRTIENEICAHAAARHDHILPVHGLFTIVHGGQPHVGLVMELMNGSVFDKCVRAHGAAFPFTPQGMLARIKWSLDTATAIRYLHEVHGLAHGDIKSLNLLLNAHDEVKLADFGLALPCSTLQREEGARMDPHGGDAKVLDALAALRGTLLWRAPENFPGKRGSAKGLGAESPPPVLPIPYASDIYAFGITMYEMFAGRLPYSDILTDEEIHYDLERHVCKPFAPLRPNLAYLHADTPRDIRTLMQQCWQPDPASRPTADAVVQALQGVLHTFTQAPSSLLGSAAVITSDAAAGSAPSMMAPGLATLPSTFPFGLPHGLPHVDVTATTEMHFGVFPKPLFTHAAPPAEAPINVVPMPPPPLSMAKVSAHSSVEEGFNETSNTEASNSDPFAHRWDVLPGDVSPAPHPLHPLYGAQAKKEDGVASIGSRNANRGVM
jgi:serine/threonine protein kinase